MHPRRRAHRGPLPSPRCCSSLRCSCSSASCTTGDDKDRRPAAPPAAALRPKSEPLKRIRYFVVGQRAGTWREATRSGHCSPPDPAPPIDRLIVPRPSTFGRKESRRSTPLLATPEIPPPPSRRRCGPPSASFVEKRKGGVAERKSKRAY